VLLSSPRHILTRGNQFKENERLNRVCELIMQGISQ